MVDVTPSQLELEEVGGTPAGKKVVGVDVAMQDVSYSVVVKKKKEPLKILDGITGVFKAGRMTALMGPSGSGKTTLLDVSILHVAPLTSARPAQHTALYSFD